MDAAGVLKIGTVRAATRSQFVPRSGWKAWPSTADFRRTGPLPGNGLDAAFAVGGKAGIGMYGGGFGSRAEVEVIAAFLPSLAGL